ncbi:MAG: DUF4331 family protein [Planctomycetota bacterium]
MNSTTWSVAFGLSLILSAFATDHIDGDVTKAHPLSDLADLYAFPTPGEPGHLTVVLTTYPFALPENHFSAKVDYRITLRRARLDLGTSRAVTDPASERVLDLRFDDAVEPHVMTASGHGLSRTVEFEAIERELEDGLRLFAGHRSDPFFIDALWSTKIARKGKLPPGKGNDSMAGMSVLAIAVDVDLRRLFGADVGLLALVAESLNAQTGARFDRVARPEATNLSLVAHGEQPVLKDAHNQLAPFAADGETAPFRRRLGSNVAYYDGLDGVRQWSATDAARYAALMADDVLLVDVSKPVAGEGYYAIEEALLAGREPATAGGRWPTDDVIDRLLTTLVNHDRGPTVSDHVDAPHLAPTDRFPYLRAPRDRWTDRIKTRLLRKISGVPSCQGGVKGALEDHGHPH